MVNSKSTEKNKVKLALCFLQWSIFYSLQDNDDDGYRSQTQRPSQVRKPSL
jgi:hypothetical protein